MKRRHVMLAAAAAALPLPAIARSEIAAPPFFWECRFKTADGWVKWEGYAPDYDAAVEALMRPASLPDFVEFDWSRLTRPFS